MDGISIGPLLFSAQRLAAIAAIALLFLAGRLLARRVDPRFDLWTIATVVLGLAAGRAAYVAGHMDEFGQTPLRALEVWQGGLAWGWAAAGAALAGLFVLRAWRSRAWAVAAVAAAAICGLAVDRLTPRPPPIPLPSASLVRLDGRSYELAARDGRPTVVNLWATWCPPCRREMPMLEKAAARDRGVRFVLADQGESREQVLRFLGGRKLAPDDVVLDPGRSLMGAFRTQGLPTTAIFGQDGRLVSARLGEISSEELQDTLDRLRQPPAQRSNR